MAKLEKGRPGRSRKKKKIIPERMELVSADQTRSRANEPRKEGYFSIY